jgi:hypothetical protein
VSRHEVPCVTCDQREFDTIYHEHLCYFSVTAVDHLFRRHGLYLNEVRRLPIHGGSLRFYVERRENVGESVSILLAEENRLGLDRADYYHDFSARVEQLKKSLLTLLDLKAQKSVSPPAPPQKRHPDQFAGIRPELVNFVVVDHKQGMFMPGQKIPIYPSDRILKEKPDYVVLLPWNLESEILKQESAFREAGGQFIIPVPVPRIV